MIFVFQTDTADTIPAFSSPQMSRSLPSYSMASSQKENSSLCIQPNSLPIWAGRLHLQTACISYSSKQEELRKSSTEEQMVFQLLKNVPKMFQEWSTHWSLLQYSVLQSVFSSYLDKLFHSPLLITSEEKMWKCPLQGKAEANSVLSKMSI